MSSTDVASELDHEPYRYQAAKINIQTSHIPVPIRHCANLELIEDHEAFHGIMIRDNYGRDGQWIHCEDPVSIDP